MYCYSCSDTIANTVTYSVTYTRTYTVADGVTYAVAYTIAYTNAVSSAISGSNTISNNITDASASPTALNETTAKAEATLHGIRRSRLPHALAFSRVSRRGPPSARSRAPAAAGTRARHTRSVAGGGNAARSDGAGT